MPARNANKKRFRSFVRRATTHLRQPGLSTSRLIRDQPTGKSGAAATSYSSTAVFRQASEREPLSFPPETPVARRLLTDEPLYPNNVKSICELAHTEQFFFWP